MQIFAIMLGSEASQEQLANRGDSAVPIFDLADVPERNFDEVD